MATSSKIKSTIRAKGASQRKLTKQLAGVSRELMKARESSLVSELEQKEEDRMFGAFSSGLEVAASTGELFKQKADLEKNISAFEGSLPDSVSNKYRVEKAPSLIDVFRGKEGISSYMDGKAKGDQYFLGDKMLGSKYDVAARGKEILSKDLAKNLLDSIENPSLMDMTNPSLPSMEMPKMNFDFKSIYGQPSTMQIKPKRTSLADGGMIGRAVGNDPKGISLGDIFDIPEREDT